MIKKIISSLALVVMTTILMGCDIGPHVKLQSRFIKGLEVRHMGHGERAVVSARYLLVNPERLLYLDLNAPIYNVDEFDVNQCEDGVHKPFLLVHKLNCHTYYVVAFNKKKFEMRAMSERFYDDSEQVGKVGRFVMMDQGEYQGNLQSFLNSEIEDIFNLEPPTPVTAVVKVKTVKLTPPEFLP